MSAYNKYPVSLDLVSGTVMQLAANLPISTLPYAQVLLDSAELEKAVQEPVAISNLYSFAALYHIPHEQEGSVAWVLYGSMTEHADYDQTSHLSHLRRSTISREMIDADFEAHEQVRSAAQDFFYPDPEGVRNHVIHQCVKLTLPSVVVLDFLMNGDSSTPTRIRSMYYPSLIGASTALMSLKSTLAMYDEAA